MKRRFERALTVAAAVLVMVAGTAAQTHGDPEEFTAFAINMGAYTGTGGTAQLIITVNHWATQAEQDAFFVTLREKGSEALLEQLRRAKRVGSLRTAQTVGWDIRLAIQEPGKDGGRRVLLLTDRPIGFSEATNRPITIDYPFTLMEIRVNPKGEGEGKMAVATKIQFDKDKRTMVLENYSSEPVRLQQVRVKPRT